MADINQIISLGIGTPADIPHFLLVGLSTNANVLEPTPDVTIQVRAMAQTVDVRAFPRTIAVQAPASEVDVT